jgi:hypothetical protein
MSTPTTETSPGRDQGPYMAKNCRCGPPTARIDGGSWWQRRQQQQEDGRRQSKRRRRARRKEGVSCAAAGERDRASAAIGVWDRADSSGSSRCTLRTMHSFTPYHAFIHR